MSRRVNRGRPTEVVRIPVPLLGTTWYDRGVAYWVRRALFAAGLFVTLLTALVLAWGLVTAAWQSHPAAGTAVGSVIGVTGVVSGVWVWRRSTPQAIEERARAGRVSPAADGVGTAGGLLGATALAGNMVAVAVLVVASSLMLGVIVVFLLRSLGSQLPQERVERVLLNIPLRPRRPARNRVA